MTKIEKMSLSCECETEKKMEFDANFTLPKMLKKSSEDIIKHKVQKNKYTPSITNPICQLN